MWVEMVQTTFSCVWSNLRFRLLFVKKQKKVRLCLRGRDTIPFTSYPLFLQLVLHLLKLVHHVTPYEVDATRDACYFYNLPSIPDICLYGVHHIELY